MDVYLHQVIYKKIYLWPRADFDDIRTIANNLSEEFLNEFDSDTPIEVLWSEFKTICKKCLDQVPTKLSVKCPRQPRINSKIKRFSNKRQCLYNKARRTGDASDVQIYKQFKKLV